MILQVERLPLDGLALVRCHRFVDDRGYFLEAWSRDGFAAVGLKADFAQDNQSLSCKANTLRGLHFQKPPFEQAKLVRVLQGSIFDVVVDIRRTSPTFGRWHAVKLTSEDGSEIYIPRGFAHGFLTMEPNTLVMYKVDAPYAPAYEGGIRWNDDALAIDWPVAEVDVILSERDRDLPSFLDLT